MTRSVKVSVAGQQFSLRTDAQPRYLQELADFVTEKVEEARRSGRTITTQSLALLAAINIADELYQLRTSQRELKRQVREKTERILNYLERAAGT